MQGNWAMVANAQESSGNHNKNSNSIALEPIQSNSAWLALDFFGRRNIALPAPSVRRIIVANTHGCWIAFTALTRQCESIHKRVADSGLRRENFGISGTTRNQEIFSI
jgi:hypothetical protein